MFWKFVLLVFLSILFGLAEGAFQSCCVSTFQLLQSYCVQISSWLYLGDLHQQLQYSSADLL